MKRINEGDYVRVKYMWGNERIARVEKVLDKDPCYYNMRMYRIDEAVQHSNAHYLSTKIYDEDIVAHSPKISNLIKLGDYVNGQKIIKITKDPFIKGQIDLWTGRTIPFDNDFQQERFIEEDIEDVLTKEQIEEERYVVNR